MKYKILEHPADLKIRVFAKDKKELFLNAMKGMFDCQKSKIKNQKSEIKRKIQIKSQGLESLLIDFLSEVLYFSEVYKEVYEKIIFEKFSDREIKGLLIGKKLKEIGVQIKGVTYHDLEIKQKKDGAWQAVVLFDI